MGHVAYTAGATASAIYLDGILVAEGCEATMGSTAPQVVRFGSLVSKLAGTRGLNGAIDDIYRNP